MLKVIAALLPSSAVLFPGCCLPSGSTAANRNRALGWLQLFSCGTVRFFSPSPTARVSCQLLIRRRAGITGTNPQHLAPTLTHAGRDGIVTRKPAGHSFPLHTTPLSRGTGMRKLCRIHVFARLVDGVNERRTGRPKLTACAVPAAHSSTLDLVRQAIFPRVPCYYYYYYCCYYYCEYASQVGSVLGSAVSLSHSLSLAVVSLLSNDFSDVAVASQMIRAPPCRSHSHAAPVWG